MADQVIPESNSETMYTDSFSNSARECANITPHDTNDLDPYARAIRVGVAGDVTIQTPRGTSVTFVGVQTGDILPVNVKRLMATGTDATDFIAFYG